MNTCSRSTPAGFSLVEIAVALGVIAVGFVAILGLLPTSMDVFRSSMNLSITTQIAQRLLNDAQQTDFKVLTGGAVQLPYHELPVRYFDHEGNELPEDKADERVFEAHTVVQSKPGFPDSKGDNTIIMDDLAAVVVQVAVNPGRRPLKQNGDTLFWEPTEHVQIMNHTVMVSDNG